MLVPEAEQSPVMRADAARDRMEQYHSLVKWDTSINENFNHPRQWAFTGLIRDFHSSTNETPANLYLAMAAAGKSKPFPQTGVTIRGSVSEPFTGPMVWSTKPELRR